jgi:hypothetical protein
MVTAMLSAGVAADMIALAVRTAELMSRCMAPFRRAPQSSSAERMRRWRERKRLAAAQEQASVTETPSQQQSAPAEDDGQISFSFDFASEIDLPEATAANSNASSHGVTVTSRSPSSLSKDLQTSREEERVEREIRAREPASRVTGGRRKPGRDPNQLEMRVYGLAGTPYPSGRVTPPAVLAAATKLGLSAEQASDALAKCALHYRSNGACRSDWDAAEELWLKREAKYLGVKPREPPHRVADNWATERLRLEEDRYRSGYYSGCQHSEAIEDLAERVRLIDREGLDPDRALEVVTARRAGKRKERDGIAQGHREASLRQQNG